MNSSRPSWESGAQRPSWDVYFMEIAKAVSMRGDCTRSRVGAVLVERDHTIIQTGYNGTIPGEAGCIAGACPRGRQSYSERPPGGDYLDCIARHAEANALWFAGRKHLLDRVAGGTCYITRECCSDCRKLLKWAFLARVVYPGGEERL